MPRFSCTRQASELLLRTLIYRKGSVTRDRLRRSKTRIIINPPTLIGHAQIERNAKLLLTLHYKKRPPGDDPSGYSFVD
jgi:hypothetical protein